MNQLELLNHPLITQVLFHPRKDIKNEVDNPLNKMIPVENNVEIGARLHLFSKDFPNLIYFHGNAEMVSEYDEFAEIYNTIGINFIPVDYRGYGFSSGSPSFSTMISDSIKIFNDLKSTLEFKGFRKPIFLMGRSLGSASILEIVQNNQDKIGGIIIESGFAYIEPLFKLFGVDPVQLGINPKNSINHIEKIKNYLGPLLVIHAKQDQIISFNEGVDLYQNAPSIKKSNYWVENAHHNNIIQIMGMEYFQLVREFIVT